MRKSGYRFVLMIYSTLLVVVALMILIGSGLVINQLISTDPNSNRVKSNWPLEYTRDFSIYFDLNSAVPIISQAGIQSLDNNHLWAQILDKNGYEVFAHNTTATQLKHYSPTQFLELEHGNDNSGEIVCTNTVTTNEGEWTYLIGFPMSITKVTMYLNGNSFTGGKFLIIILLAVGVLLIFTCGGILGVWMIRHMRKMAQAIAQIPCRLYRPIYGSGPFQDVYDRLNEMSGELLRGDKELAQNELLREEWITNITHDLKTPLSPIRGYAELLADPHLAMPYEKRVQYAHIILKNAHYAEELVNDLKLTYQLKNNMLPLNMKEASLSRFIKEIIIEILNRPLYADREIIFVEAGKDIRFRFDKRLLKRAIDNLIYNALQHNPEQTNIHVVLQVGESVTILIDDDGNGMSAAEVKQLFERYYRGTNTETHAGGTGLGMAIAKQIIELHGGDIHVESEPGKGTHIGISFPTAN